DVSVVVDWKSPGRPDDTRRRAGPIGDDVLCNIVDLHDSASVGGVTGDDTADLQTHCVVLVVAKCAGIVRTENIRPESRRARRAAETWRKFPRCGPPARAIPPGPNPAAGHRPIASPRHRRAARCWR